MASRQPGGFSCTVFAWRLAMVLHKLPAFPAADVLHAVIECPRGATSKVKYDEALEAFALSRPLPLGLHYPHDWGFVPGTKAADGDPVDVLVLSEGTTFPGLVIRVRALGSVSLEQNAKEHNGRERNDRIIAVPLTAPRAEWRTHADLSQRVREEIAQFFLNVTFFENKNARILGWQGPEQALALVRASLV